MSRHLVTVEGDPNAASRFITYRSPRLSSRTSPGLLGLVMGPTSYGEVVTVVSIERILRIDGWESCPEAVIPLGTRLGFRFGIVPGLSHDVGQDAPELTPAEIEAAAGMLSEQVRPSTSREGLTAR